MFGLSVSPGQNPKLYESENHKERTKVCFTNALPVKLKSFKETFFKRQTFLKINLYIPKDFL